MKKILIFMIMSLAIPGTVYLGADVSGWYDGDSYSEAEDFDEFAILVGYNHPVYQNENLGLAVGASFMMQSLYRETWMDAGSGIIWGGQEASFISLYALPTYAFTDDVSAWLTLGLNKQTEDYYDDDTGLMYGLGFNYKVTDKWGVSLGYVINNTSSNDEDVSINRVSLYLGYNL